jgi:PAS domain S-box-containing protein
MRGADLAYFEWSPAKETFSRTPQFDLMFGFSQGEQGNATQPFIDRVHPDDLPNLRAEMDRSARTIGADLHCDYRVVWPDGTTRWLISRGESIQDPNTQQILVVGTVVDVTHMKENEVRLREALAARDLLIAEVNHRVKNSLQMVTSILNLEGNGVEDETARRSLEAATARVRAVAAIHASLYEDENIQSVQIARYLDRLVEHLRASLSGIGEGTRVELDVDPIRVPTDTAVTLSLAVNELVTNSFKHGSWNEGEGAVLVRLHRDGTGMIALEVSDNGTGKGDKPLALTSSGLGKRLISGMAAQLGGTVEEEQNNGWRTRIHFPG